jgi:hypothetical protein
MDEIEGLRRSLAIGGMLTRSDIEELLDGCSRLITERSEIERIFAELGSAWSDARQALNELHRLLRRNRPP